MLQLLERSNWIGIFVDSPTTDDLIESNALGKRVKTSPHMYSELREYSYTCFLDSKSAKINELFVEDIIRCCFIEREYAMLLREHWFIPGSVWKEFNASMQQERYRIESERYRVYIDKQIKAGLSATTTHHCACGLLIRNMKHSMMNAINELWYEHIQECGIQDQISFFFVKQRFASYIKAFAENPFC
jgi:hypothetical protein